MTVKKRLFVTRALPESVQVILKRRYRVLSNREDRPLSRAELISGVREADGLVSMLSDSIDRSVIAAGKRLAIISNYAAGYNNIDLAEATRRGIAVTNTPGILTETTADLAWALLLAVARRLREGDRLIATRRWTGWAPTQLLGSDVHGRTLGIVGMGRIGRAVARRASGFSMPVLYASRRRLPATEERRLGARFVSLDRLLREADFVSLHLPLTKKSRHLINRAAFRRMKRTAYLINTARGPVVDEAALADALAQGLIAGAGLDVFEGEPKITPRLHRLDNVVLMPHLGSATHETRHRMGEMVVKNLDEFFSGKRPPNRLN